MQHAGRDLFVAQASTASVEQFDAANLTSGWSPKDGSDDVLWIAGRFVEADNPNSNKQFWTAGDLEMAEYSIKYAPLNIAHKYSHPVGFFAETRKVSLERKPPALQMSGSFSTSAATFTQVTSQGSMHIEALAGMWSHIFPEQAALVVAADAAGELFYSMECVGSHLKCAGPNGCGGEFAYQDVSSHCTHLQNRTSIRHIVNPVFRGGALIIPPVRPGWKNANATVLSQEALREAAEWVDVHSDSLKDAASHMSVRDWEALMGMVIQTHVQSSGR